MSDFFITTLSCHQPLQTHYQALSHLPGFILLESARLGRFDIVTAFPYDRLISSNPAADLFEQLKQRLPEKPSFIDLPFQGGALGYFSYELGAHMMGVSSASIARIDDLPSVHIGFYDWAIITDHLEKKITLFSANTRSETSDYIKHVLDLWHQAGINTSTFFATSFEPLISKEAYRDGFSTIHDYLKKGRCYQVNYTQPFEADFSGDSFALYRKITEKNPVPFGGFLRLDDMDILSFSPERFLSMNKGILSTSPIKGTAKSTACPIENEKIQMQLKNCIKNRAENVMIVDLWRNDLGQISKPGTVKVPALFALQSYRGLHHLVSTVEGECLPSIHPVDAFKACFPGGSVTGTPKKESMHVIQELEPYTRGVYCGSIAWFSFHGDFDSNIAIRTMVLKKNRLHLAAGGAIVMDSVLEDEYRECYTKIAGISHW